jgi:hypothetical protein
MYTLALDTKEATNKFAAFRDARMRSYAASTHYTDAEKVIAERIKMCLELVYRAREVYVTFRKGFIAIKLDDAGVRDRKGLEIIERDIADRGVVKVVTAQGITYRIPKRVG